MINSGFRNSSEYLLRFANRTVQNKISILIKSILAKSQGERWMAGIVIDDGSKLAPAILTYIQKHPECRYFRIGQSYDQISLACEIYQDICKDQPPSSFIMAADFIKKVSESIGRKRLKPLLIIDAVHWFNPFRLSSWISKINQLRGKCGVIMIFKRETVRNLRIYEMDRVTMFSSRYEYFDRWYWLDGRGLRLPCRSKSKKIH